jgi:lysyl-tRNA synthetase class II
MLEAYEAYGNWETMAELVEDMICTVAMEVLGTTKITISARSGASPDRKEGVLKDNAAAREDAEPLPHGRGSQSEPGPRVIDLNKRPWRRVSMADVVYENTGWQFDQRPLSEADPDLYDMLHTYPGEEVDEDLHGRRHTIFPDLQAVEFADRSHLFFSRYGISSMDLKRLDEQPAEQLVRVFERVVEGQLIEPTFVTRVPSVIIPLARPCEDDPYFADVYELAIGGQEISPGYTELNDPDVQAQLFADQAVEDEGERQKVDHDFLHALKVGMPPAGGMGLGVDRLVMLLAGQASIRDVLAFPLMKPSEEQAS